MYGEAIVSIIPVGHKKNCVQGRCQKRTLKSPSIKKEEWDKAYTFGGHQLSVFHETAFGKGNYHCKIKRRVVDALVSLFLSIYPSFFLALHLGSSIQSDE